MRFPEKVLTGRLSVFCRHVNFDLSTMCYLRHLALRLGSRYSASRFSASQALSPSLQTAVTSVTKSRSYFALVAAGWQPDCHPLIVSTDSKGFIAVPGRRAAQFQDDCLDPRQCSSWPPLRRVVCLRFGGTSLWGFRTNSISADGEHYGFEAGYVVSCGRCGSSGMCIRLLQRQSANSFQFQPDAQACQRRLISDQSAEPGIDATADSGGESPRLRSESPHLASKACGISDLEHGDFQISDYLTLRRSEHAGSRRRGSQRRWQARCRNREPVRPNKLLQWHRNCIAGERRRHLSGSGQLCHRRRNESGRDCRCQRRRKTRHPGGERMQQQLLIRSGGRASRQRRWHLPTCCGLQHWSGFLELAGGCRREWRRETRPPGVECLQ